jgi:site-specific DNA recombinase
MVILSMEVVMKRYVALARVSSREQEREGFSLEVQEEALRRYAAQAGGEIAKLFRIAETASKSDERKTFRELVGYAKKNAGVLDGLLFYKVDRAARNLFDYVELERLESEYDLPFISVSQPTESTPAGRMMRRTLANMASFFTEQQSVDVREGLARRVREGWFVSRGPYGYRNVRKNGRGTVELDPIPADNVKRIFQLYAYENYTLDTLVRKLAEESRSYRDSMPKFPRSSVHTILSDRSYIGEIEFRGEWYPGKHTPLVDRATWDRVQALLGGHVHHAMHLTYAGAIVQCGHCGHAITGERVAKKTKDGERYYVYYRCTHYLKQGHPRVRIPEPHLEKQVMAIFDKMRVEDESVREWFRLVLASQTKDEMDDTRGQRVELQRQHTLLNDQQERVLNLRIADNIDQETYARKCTELRDRIAAIKLQIDVLDRSSDETCDLATRVFELSQTLKQQWLTADYHEKRRLLDIVLLNCRLDDVTLVPTMRKPFDVLAEGLVCKESRGERIRTFDPLVPNQMR